VIQGAMQIEVDALVRRLPDATSESVAGWTFWRGTLDGYPVVVSKTLKGTANAAAATTLAAEHFHPAAILNQGTAGGHDPELHLYDIVVGAASVNIGAFRATYRAAGAGSNPADWRPMDLTAADGTASNDPNARRLARFDADASLLAAARAVKNTYTRGKVVEGVIGSSDLWRDEIDVIAALHRSFGTSVEEMETAAAAQVAKAFHVPFIGIRVVSDNITNGGGYEPKTSEACEDFVLNVAKAYIATLKR
jgi:adenosylhomocysteine nucleosidase